MAKIGSCRYCPAQTVDSEWCPECRIAHLENIIFKIQGVLKKSRRVPAKLAQDIADEQVRSWKEFQGEKAQASKREGEHVLWELAKNAKIRKMAAKFEKKHPDPNPPTY